MMNIGGKGIGPNHPTLIIAEIAQAHDGSLGQAHAYIDAVARTGADAIKFQTHIAAAESTPGEPWRIKFSRQDDTRYEYWQRMEFTPEQWVGLSEHARESGLLFLSTPFSMEAADLLIKLDMEAWKIGSGEVTNGELIGKLAKTGKPVLLSSGMSRLEEVRSSVELVRSRGSDVAVFQCTSQYPCPPEAVGLNVLAELREAFQCPVGLSDHSGTIYPALAATALGANLIEIHTVFSRDCFGPDTTSSVTIDQLAQLVEGVRFTEKAIKNPIDKEAMADELGEMRRIFSKSMVSASSLKTGQKLNRADIVFKKPGTGIPHNRMDEFIGKTLRTDVPANTILEEQHFE
jgi:N,N'-diacetyllegionaminate synthase